MFYAHHQEPLKPKKLPWYGRYSNRLIIFLSLVFLLMGLGLLGVGIVMFVLMRNKFLDRDEVKAIFDQMEFNGDLTIGTVLNNLPILTICVGATVFCLGIFLCCGRGCKNRACLSLSALFMFWFLIVLILTCVMWVMMRDKFETEVKGHLETSFLSYAGVSSTEATSIGWDLIHIGFDCCSLNVITFSSNSYTFNVTTWWGTRDSTLDLIPTSCCSEVNENTYKSFTDSDCERILLAHNKQGCYEEIVSWLTWFWRPAINLCIFSIVVQVMLIFLSCALCCGIRKSREIKY